MQPAQPDGKTPLIRAAQYIRMSTEHQQYSTENQADVIRAYAAARGYEIVQTYADHGKSGLRIEGRESLKKLLDDIQSRRANFEAVLVYDVSRWGRFQDSDESAYYEHTCKRAGIRIEYCAEQFENDGSPVSTIIKGVKRAMAAEYSRELSAKVFQGQCRLIQLGFRQGGPAGFGLRRMLIDPAGKKKEVLKRGEHKSLQTDRVVLIAGPTEELRVVQEVYRRFLHEGQTEASSIGAPDQGCGGKGRAVVALVHEGREPIVLRPHAVDGGGGGGGRRTCVGRAEEGEAIEHLFLELLEVQIDHGRDVERQELRHDQPADDHESERPARGAVGAVSALPFHPIDFQAGRGSARVR